MIHQHTSLQSYNGQYQVPADLRTGRHLLFGNNKQPNDNRFLILSDNEVLTKQCLLPEWKISTDPDQK